MTKKILYLPWIDLTKIAIDPAEMIVIAPPTAASCIEVPLPSLKSSQLQQALPFLLEENLIDDVETLHFATGKFQQEGTAVAIVSKKMMREWLAALKNINVFPSAIIPAPLALSYEENHWHIALTEHHAIVRMGKYSGFSCDKNNLNLLLELKINEDRSAPEKIILENYSDDKNFQLKTNRPVEINEHAPEQFIQDLTKWNQENPVINLLQGEYGVKKDFKKSWQIPSYLALGAIAILFLGNVLGSLILYFQAAQIEHQIKIIYKKNFPESTVMISPRDRMQAKLNSIAAGQDLFLSSLTLIGKSFTETPKIQLQNLQFHHQQFSIELSADSFNTLDHFVQSMKTKGLAVKQQSAAMIDNQVKANLLIEAGKTE